MKMIESKAEKQDLPAFNAGDTVKVHQRVVEGNKQRIQVFEGVVIARRGSRSNASFTVRNPSALFKVSASQGGIEYVVSGMGTFVTTGLPSSKTTTGRGMPMNLSYCIRRKS